MSEAARNLVRFVSRQHDVIVICNPAAGSIIILASPAGQDAVELALPDALQWLDPAADLYFREGWQQTTVITGTPGAEIANMVERQGVSVLVAAFHLISLNSSTILSRTAPGSNGDHPISSSSKSRTPSTSALMCCRRSGSSRGTLIS